MEPIETALEELRPGLDADGFDLRLSQVEASGRVHIVLEARPDACHDCLVPDDVLVQILTTSIRARQQDVTEVVLEKVGF